MNIHKELFESNVRGIKNSRNDQVVGKCPFHNDKKRSWSGNTKTGLWKCHAGCGSGNAYQFAERLGIAPKPYIQSKTELNKSIVTTPVLNNIETKSLRKKAMVYMNYLLEHWDDLPVPISWDKEYIKKTYTGWDNYRELFTYAHTDEDGEIINLHWHKSNSEGNGICKLYPMSLIVKYNKNETLYIVEGEKDEQSMLPIYEQVASATTGALGIPQDISPIIGYKNVVIIYDNDKAGKDGSQLLAKHLKTCSYETEIRIANWINDIKGYDVTDSIANDDTFEELDKVIRNAEPFYLKKIGKFNIITGLEASSMDVPDVEWIIEGLLPKNYKAILGGTTGSNKSYFAMELSMRVANGSSRFIGYKILKQLRVLFIDLEVGNVELVRRFQRISNTISFKELDNIMLLSKSGTFTDCYDDILQAGQCFKSDLIVIDNLYSSVGDVDIGKADKIKPVLGKIDELKEKTGASILLIHHFNKMGNEMGLITDRMQGSSSLQNWMEYCILLTKTNQQDMRLMRIAKSRGTRQSEEVYGLRWNSDTFTLEMLGIVRNWQQLLTTDYKRQQWESALEGMADEFTANEWVNKVECEMNMSKETAYGWLRELQTNNMIEKIKHGEYRKTGMEIINEE